MKRKLAILQCADQGPIESLVVMLRAVGYECVLPNQQLRDELSRLGGLVLSPEDCEKRFGYDPPMPLERVGVSAMDRCDLYADVKAHQVHAGLVKRWPRLQNRVVWYRINGAEIEHVINDRGDHGNEIDPPCPVLTPNMNYAKPGPWSKKAYVMWPPFVRFDEYANNRYDGVGYGGHYTEPICLVHNARGWGHEALFSNFRGMGVKIYGAGSPDGMIQHREVPSQLASALAYVHLKSSDSPGYSLYESLASGCPVICTRRLIWRCNMGSLFVPDETCLVFDRETHEGLTPKDVEECTREVAYHLERLQDPVENRRIGMNGRKRLQEIMWSAEKPEDVASLRTFLERNFP